MYGRDKTKVDTYMMKTVLNMFRRKQLNSDHPLQRNANQWSAKGQSGLIASILKDEDIDPIKLCEQILSETELVIWLIDGLQRLSVAEEFRQGFITIRDDIDMPTTYYQGTRDDGTFGIVEYDLRGKNWNNLPDELKDRFDSYGVNVVKQLDCTDEEVAYHINRYNQHTSMNTNQKNILPMYKVAKFVKSISKNHIFFKDCGNYTEVEKKKGVIDRVVSESVMAISHLDNWKKSAKMSLYLNDNATEEEFDSFSNELDNLSEVVDQDTTGKLFNSKNSFIWFTLYDRFTRLNLPDSRFGDFLEEFQSTLHNKEFDQYENKSFDTYDKEKGTKDKTVVITKIKMLEELMCGFFGVESIPQKTESATQPSSEEMKDEEPEVLDFVKDTLNTEVQESDIDDYYDLIDDYKKLDGVNAMSKVFDWHNELSLIAMVAYAFKNDIDIDEWLVNYSNRAHTYSSNQKENFLHMKEDLEKFEEGNVA